MWKILASDAWGQFLENPIFGSAVVEMNSRTYPHNMVVESFMAIGLIGGLLFSTILLVSIGFSLKLILQRSQSSWLAMLFIQTAIGCQFSGSLSFDPFFWAMLGVTASIMGSTSETRKAATARQTY